VSAGQSSTSFELLEFTLEPGVGWTHFKDRPRVVFHRNTTEVIVSAFRVEGGVGQEAAEALRRAREAAIASAVSAARHEDLEPAQSNSEAEAWWLSTTTRDGTTFFGQVVVEGRSSVLLLTYESPNTAAHIGEFQAVVRSAEGRPTQIAIA
jgi:hypothetical protein